MRRIVVLLSAALLLPLAGCTTNEAEAARSHASASASASASPGMSASSQPSATPSPSATDDNVTSSAEQTATVPAIAATPKPSPTRAKTVATQPIPAPTTQAPAPAPPWHVNLCWNSDADWLTFVYQDDPTFTAFYMHRQTGNYNGTEIQTWTTPAGAPGGFHRWTRFPWGTQSINDPQTLIEFVPAGQTTSAFYSLDQFMHDANTTDADRTAFHDMADKFITTWRAHGETSGSGQCK